ncbi:ribosome silencing factor [Candidatus Omnitrophota bacterium]
MNSRQKALLVAELAKAKKAEDIVVLDMRKLSNVADFFIIATAGSTRRAQAVIDNVENGLLKKREPLSNIAGYQDGRWILLDAYGVVAHIFDEELRRFYNLEGLWGEAPRVRLWQRKRRKLSRKPSKRR